MTMYLPPAVVEALKEAQKNETTNMGYAAKKYEEVIAVVPDYLPALVNIGCINHGMGNLEKAAEWFEKALAVDENDILSLINIGVIKQAQKKFEEAISYCELVLRLEKNNVMIRSSALFTIGTALEESGNRKGAMRKYKEALEIVPTYNRIYNNIGSLYMTQGRVDEGIPMFDLCLQAEPENLEARINRGLALMTLGRYKEGMADYEWRLVSKDSTVGQYMRSIGVPKWRGESLKDKTILVHCEQGIGDTIFSMRYIRQLQERGARVTFAAQKEIQRLAEQMPDVKVVSWHQKTGFVDYQLSLLSIPHVTQQPITDDKPYLTISDDLVKEWAERLGPKTKPRIALVWAGNPKFKHEKSRGGKLEDFIPIFSQPGFEFFSVQKGIAAYQTERFPQVTPLHPEIRDYADTGAILKNMDLLISTDTSVPHLAGAIGVPVKLLVQFSPEWRLYGTHTNSTWYEKTKFYRQEKPGSWSDVVEKIAEELKMAETVEA
jgi:tetratricopeptide (TPR) repeat protein